MAENVYPVREDWEDYYKTLEAIRRTGVCNMFGAAVYLRECFPDLTEQESNNILANWMNNYDALNKKFGWQR